MRMKSYFLTVLCILLVSCQAETVTESPPEEDNPPRAEATVEVSNEFIVWGQSALTRDIDLYMEEIFEELHPEIDVVFVDAGWDEALRQNFENSIMIGRPPEITIGENYFRTFASRGELQAVDEIIASYEDVVSATYAGATYEGSVYAVPYLTGIFAFERNCNVIDSAGLDCDSPPQYWDELLEQAIAITEAGNGDYFGYTIHGPGGTAVGSAFRIAVLQAQLDALPCSDDSCTSPDFNRPETQAVYDFLRQMVPYTPPGLVSNANETEVYSALFNGVSAYQIAGSWHPDWAESTGCDSCAYSALPLPRDGEASNLLVGNVLYAAPSGSLHPELALEWLELLLSDEIQSMIFPVSARLPVRRSVLEALQSDVDEATVVFIDALLNDANLKILPQWENNPGEIWSIYNDLLEGVLLTERPVDELMAEAQEAVESLED